jgi:hypothetical protein
VATEPRRQSSSDEAREAKRKLEALFGGPKAEPPPEPPVDQKPPIRRTSTGPVFASPRRSTGRTPSDFRMRLERLRMAREPEEIRQAADQFLQRHQLPDEVDILFKVLLHPDERVIREALGQLSSLLMQGRLNGTMLLEDRLNELQSRVRDEATLSYIAGMRKQVEAIKAAQ